MFVNIFLFAFSLFLVSEEKEKDLLLRLNSCPKAVHHDPVARRFRRKLMLRQVSLETFRFYDEYDYEYEI